MRQVTAGRPLHSHCVLVFDKEDAVDLLHASATTRYAPEKHTKGIHTIRSSRLQLADCEHAGTEAWGRQNQNPAPTHVTSTPMSPAPSCDPVIHSVTPTPHALLAPLPATVALAAAPATCFPAPSSTTTGGFATKANLAQVPQDNAD